MKVADVMTRNVITIGPGATVEDAAKLMLERNVSGLVVATDAGQLAGIVTEHDLLRRAELGTERQRSWWQRILTSTGQQAADFIHAHGRRVSDVMTKDVVTAGAETTLEELVALMEQHHIKRVPVTENGIVAGVVSRADLLRALITASEDMGPPGPTDDDSIREAILAELGKTGWAPVSTLDIAVKDGVAELAGVITSDEERRAICVLAENTPGVTRVTDRMVLVEPMSGTVLDNC
jgi:CBS-domain-containing membrane protein